MYQRIQMNFLGLITLLLLVSFLFTSEVCANAEPALIIEIYDSNNWDERVDAIFFEGKTYDVLVCSQNETVILDVNISYLGIRKKTNTSEPFVTITAPRFDDTQSFIINASKEGYLDAEIEITVFKGQLFMTIDQSTFEENKEFQVLVQDQNNKPIEGVYVYLTLQSSPVITDLQGVAYLRSPDVELLTTYTIQAIKNGYISGSANIRVENIQGFAFDFTDSQFLKILPILIAVFVVIFSIVYVFWRQKRSSQISYQVNQKKPPEIPPTIQEIKQNQSTKNEPVIIPEKRYDSNSIPSTRIEEIRIPVQVKKKQTTLLPTEKPSPKVSRVKEKEQDEWFKGQDYMRHKINELTGVIDKKTDGKWFEGEHDIKNKIDQTLRIRFINEKVEKKTVKFHPRFIRNKIEKKDNK